MLASILVDRVVVREGSVGAWVVVGGRWGGRRSPAVHAGQHPGRMCGCRGGVCLGLLKLWLWIPDSLQCALNKVFIGEASGSGVLVPGDMLRQ